MTTNDDTPIVSITPENIELIKAFLTYQDLRKKTKKPKKYTIKIELDIISSNSEEYSAEDEATESDSPPSFSETETSDFNEEPLKPLEKMIRKIRL
jgi:hypothetical protein